MKKAALKENLFFSMTWDYLNIFLPSQHQDSPLTTKSYEDGLTIFRRYITDVRKLSIENFRFSDLTYDFMLDYREYLVFLFDDGIFFSVIFDQFLNGFLHSGKLFAQHGELIQHHVKHGFRYHFLLHTAHRLSAIYIQQAVCETNQCKKLFTESCKILLISVFSPYMLYFITTTHTHRSLHYIRIHESGHNMKCSKTIGVKKHGNLY